MIPASGPLKTALVAMNQPGYRSLALGYVRAYAEAHERLAGAVAFQTLDLSVELDPWSVAFQVLGLRPDAVGLSAMCWNARKVLETCKLIKSASPETLIVLGGPEVGPIAERVLLAGREVDVIVRGEGEATFADLLVALVEGREPWTVPGVTARDGDRVISAPDRELIADLDLIPSPYLWGLLPPVDGSTYIETYRGCPFTCGYCFEGKGYGKIRSFSRESVADEVACIAGASGVHAFSFIDPVFNLSAERLQWLSDLMAPHAERGVRLHTIEVDMERIDDHQAGLLARAGVESVETGPQSIGPEALETCRRRFDRERFLAGVEALKRQGISVECDLIVGLPGDDVFDFLAGLRFAFDLDPGKVQSSTLHVLPGTDLWDRADELGLRFAEQAPHEVVQSDTASYIDIRRAEVMAKALQAIYQARVDPGRAPTSGAADSDGGAPASLIPT